MCVRSTITFIFMELSPTLFSALACAMLWILIDNRQDMENMHMFCAHVAPMKHIPWQHVMLQVSPSGWAPPPSTATDTNPVDPSV